MSQKSETISYVDISEFNTELSQSSHCKLGNEHPTLLNIVQAPTPTLFDHEAHF